MSTLLVSPTSPSTTTSSSTSISRPTSFTSPPTSRPKRRKARYAKVYGYLLDPSLINEQAIQDGTAIEGQISCTVATYMNNLARHCGMTYNHIVQVRNPIRVMPPIYCLPAASNLSKRSRIPRMDVIEKAKEFLGTTEEPKWYYILRR